MLFFAFILCVDIICFFAAKGAWPFYPAILQYQVNEMGRKVFSLSDDRIRQFCRGKFNFPETCYRPGEFFHIQLAFLFFRLSFLFHFCCCSFCIFFFSFIHLK